MTRRALYFLISFLIFAGSSCVSIPTHKKQLQQSYDKGFEEADKSNNRFQSLTNEHIEKIENENKTLKENLLNWQKIKFKADDCYCGGPSDK